MPQSPDTEQVNREQLSRKLQDAIRDAQEACTAAQAAISRAREAIELAKELTCEAYNLHHKKKIYQLMTLGLTQLDS